MSHDAGQGSARREPSGEEILAMFGGAIKFEARARRVIGHAPSATMVRQLLFWGNKGSDPEGYIYKTYKDWWDEEGLRRSGIDTARLKLGPKKFGLLEEKKKGVHNKLHYRLDLEKVIAVMSSGLDAPAAEDPVPEDATLNHNSTVQGFGTVPCRDGAEYFAGNGPSHNREYAEKTSKTKLPPIIPPRGDDGDDLLKVGSDERIMAATLAVLDEHGGPDGDGLGALLRELIVVAAEENMGSGISPGRAYQQFARPFEKAYAKEPFSEEDWRHGFDAAIRAGVGNFNYAKKVTRKRHMATAADAEGFGPAQTRECFQVATE